MSIDRPTAPLPGPRDIEGSPESTFVKCPDCLAAVFNLRHQRQAHLKWHDDLDADVASAQEATQKAQEAAERAERALGEARRQIDALTAQIAAQGPTAAAVPLVGDWPADELADRIAEARIASAPVLETGHEGEPEPDLDIAPTRDTGPVLPADAPVLAAVDDLDDDASYVDPPATAGRF